MRSPAGYPAKLQPGLVRSLKDMLALADSRAEQV